MGPFDIISLLGKYWGYFVFFLIGIGFGGVLEMSGFGDSRKLAAQFYFKEMRVLKVMFTAIIVALLLIFLSSSLGLIDFKGIWVNPTYLMPGIVGGLIMGVGFIIGGFCPGTSLVATSTLKLDGLLFLIGVLIGVGFFGETVGFFEEFWESGVKERYLLSDLFGTSIGVMVVAVILVAIIAFYWAEIGEKVFGQNIPWKEINLIPTNSKNMIATSILLFFALTVAFLGQPDADKKWQYVSAKNEPFLLKREVYIHPGELRELMHDRQLYLKVLDVRNESDYNLFHLRDADRVDFQTVRSPKFADELSRIGSNTVIVVLSNKEKDSTLAWKLLKAQGVLNIYILEGGVNEWLKYFPLPEDIAMKKKPEREEESLDYEFFKTVGLEFNSSIPEISHGNNSHQIEFIKKVKLQKKKAAMGGCG